jgi:hypothetical protein
MARIYDASFIRCKCDLTINGGAADGEPRGSGACVEELDCAGSGDHQNSLAVAAETNRTVVPAIGTKTPGRSRLFQRVQNQIFAGNGKQALVGAELEIVQRTPAKRDKPSGSAGPPVRNPNRALCGTGSGPRTRWAQSDV